MPKKPGAYHRPHDLAEAQELLGRPDSVILAGGTKLLADEAGLDADHVVDLQALGLNQITGGGGTLTIGATSTLSELSQTIARDFPQAAAGALLQEAIQREGPNTYRNAATIGGTVASRLPDSELLAALLTLDARVFFAGKFASGDLDLGAYLGTEQGQPGLITAVCIPWEDGKSAMERVARTPADYPIVSVVAWRPQDDDVRLAATGISPRPERLPTAEAAVSAGLTEDSIDAAADAAGAANRHPGDFRGDADYRSEMARVLTRRVLQALD